MITYDITMLYTVYLHITVSGFTVLHYIHFQPDPTHRVSSFEVENKKHHTQAVAVQLTRSRSWPLGRCSQE